MRTLDIFTSIKRNIGFLPLHFIFWMLRFAILYGIFRPVETFVDNFFNTRTITHDLLEYSDIHALIEFYIHSVDKGISFVIILLFIISLFFFFLIDIIMDAGFVYSFYRNDWREFWDGINARISNLFFLKLIFLLPRLLIIAFALNIFFSLQYTAINLVVVLFFAFLFGIIALFFVRFSDLSKVNLLVRNDSILKSLESSFFLSFQNIHQIFIVNFITVLLFALGVYVYFLLDLNLYARTNFVITLSLLIQQVFFLLKQMLRYSYMHLVVTANHNYF